MHRTRRHRERTRLRHARALGRDHHRNTAGLDDHDALRRHVDRRSVDIGEQAANGRPSFRRRYLQSTGKRLRQLGTEAGSRMAFITPMRKAGSPSSSSSSAGSSASSRLSPILKRFSPNNGASPVLGNSSRASSSTSSEKSHDSEKTNDKIVSGSNASMSSRKRVNFIQRNIQLCNPASRRGASVRKS